MSGDGGDVTFLAPRFSFAHGLTLRRHCASPVSRLTVSLPFSYFTRLRSPSNIAYAPLFIVLRALLVLFTP